MTFMQYIRYYYGMSEHEFNFSLDSTSQDELYNEFYLYQETEAEKDFEDAMKLLHALNH